MKKEPASMHIAIAGNIGAGKNYPDPFAGQKLRLGSPL